MLKGGGREWWSEDTLPLPGAGGDRDTDVREQKFPRETRAKSAHFSSLRCETQFVRVRVSNWLRILTSLYTFFLPCIPGHLLWDLWPWVCRWDEADGSSRIYFQCVFFPLLNIAVIHYLFTYSPQSNIALSSCPGTHNYTQITQPWCLFV